MKAMFAAALIVSLVSCRDGKPADPMCRQEGASSQFLSSHASCLILVGEHLLVLQNSKTGRYFLPGGASEKTQAAQCIAHRQTWRKTGFNTLVGQHLGDVNNQHPVFHCDLQNGFDASFFAYSPPKWADDQADSIQLHDPFALRPSEWQEYDELIKVRQLFSKANNSLPNDN